MSITRTPPQNQEAETAVLGSIMLDPSGIIKVADKLQITDFYDSRHKVIFEIMLELFKKNTSIDFLTVSNLLEEKKLLERAGGPAYLSGLVSSVPTSANLLHYVEIVQKKGGLRRLIETASDIIQLSYDENQELTDILDAAESKLFAVSNSQNKQSFVPVSDVLAESFERIDELHREKGKLRGVPTGFIEIDKKLGGFQKSDLIILAARPSVGKTTLALDFARHVGVDQKVPTAVFSLEMSKDQLVDRMLSSLSNVDLWRIRSGNLKEQDFESINEAMGRLADAPIYIDDTSSINVMEVRARARRLHSEVKLGLIVIDYLQLMHGRSPDNRVQEVSEISRGLKILARELNVPVLALSQLSRGVETRTDKQPQLADLRDSGSIEQDADVVMFIYREDTYKGQNSKRPNIAQVLIRKHRNGPTGEVDLYFDGEHTTFKNLDRVPDMSPQAVMALSMEPN